MIIRFLAIFISPTRPDTLIRRLIWDLELDLILIIVSDEKNKFLSNICPINFSAKKISNEKNLALNLPVHPNSVESGEPNPSNPPKI